MKGLVLGILAVALAGTALAQSSFTFRRPVEGQTVREHVELRIPRRAIPPGTFVGIWANGRFLEAVAPVEGATIVDNDFVYRLDTKARRIPDGRLSLEAVLYSYDARRTIPRDRTAVTVRLDNSASIRIPATGLQLRYALRPGMEYTFRVSSKTGLQNRTEAEVQLGERGNQLEFAGESFRYRYTFVNTVTNAQGQREGVVLMQPLPERGKDYAMLTVVGATEPAKYYDFNMAPLYMAITSTGREVWGAIPFFAATETSFGDANRLDLYALFPLPVLPTQGVRPGGPPYTATIQNPELNLDNRDEMTRFTTLTPGRGEFLGIEFERGRPTAKMRNVITVGTQATGLQSYEEVFWFALDLQMPIRIERRQTITVRQRQAAGTGAGAGEGAGAPGRGGRGAAGGGRPGAEGDSGVEGRWITDGPAFGPIFDQNASSALRQQRGGGGRGAMGGGEVGGDRPPAAGNGGNRPGAGAGARAGTRTRIITQTITTTLIME